MKYRIFAIVLVLCLLSGCKIELPSQHNSTGNASSTGISIAQESSSLPELASAGNSSSGKSSLSSSKASSSKPASSNQAPSAASRAPSSAPMSTPSAPTSTPSVPVKQTVLTFSITCKSILENKNRFDPAKLTAVPADGVILPETQVSYTPGESVLDVLNRIAREKNIVVSASSNNALGTAYVSSIAGIGEKIFGTQSGWMYAVNNTSPGVGAGGYKLKADASYKIEWRYVC